MVVIIIIFSREFSNPEGESILTVEIESISNHKYPFKFIVNGESQLITYDSLEMFNNVLNDHNRAFKLFKSYYNILNFVDKVLSEYKE